VVALLNEGLDEFDARHRTGLKPSGRRRRGRPPAEPARARPRHHFQGLYQRPDQPRSRRASYFVWSLA
jgi:hypothetical protein